MSLSVNYIANSIFPTFQKKPFSSIFMINLDHTLLIKINYFFLLFSGIVDIFAVKYLSCFQCHCYIFVFTFYVIITFSLILSMMGMLFIRFMSSMYNMLIFPGNSFNWATIIRVKSEISIVVKTVAPKSLLYGMDTRNISFVKTNFLFWCKLIVSILTSYSIASFP